MALLNLSGGLSPAAGWGDFPVHSRVMYWLLGWAFGLSVTAILVFNEVGPLLPLFVPFFPDGLFYPVLGSARGAELRLPLGWATYIVLSVILLRTRTRSRYVKLWTLFVALLLLNAYGCVEVLARKSAPHGW
jgi:hypothetical protein